MVKWDIDIHLPGRYLEASNVDQEILQARTDFVLPHSKHAENLEITTYTWFNLQLVVLEQQSAAAALSMAPQQTAFRIHPIYRIFFLLVEPISALVGAYYNHFRQHRYLELLNVSSTPETVPLSTSVAMSQLANMYFFFALNEAFVLRSTADIRVWRTVLLVLLVADFGHLFSMSELGSHIYWDVMSWNVSDLGNVPWVYAGATLRICFLMGIGLGESRALKKKEWRKESS